MKTVILITMAGFLCLAVDATEPKTVILGDGGTNGQVVYPDTIQPRREADTNRSNMGGNSPMSGATNYGTAGLTNQSLVVTNQPGITNAPHLKLPNP